MSCGINSFKNRIAVNQSVKVKDGSGGFELNSTLLLTVWSMVEATEEKPEEIDEGRNTRSVWYDVTTRLSPMLDTLHRLNSLFFVVDGGKTIYPKSYKIKGNLVTFKATYSYNDSVIPVYSPIAAPIGWDAQVAEYGRGYNYPQPTGQTTIYRTGDDADIEATIFAPIRVANSLKVQNSLVDFLTLGNTNSFGNTDRFTDSEGLQDYGATGSALLDYIIDNYTGLGFCRIIQPINTWNNLIDSAISSTQNGFTDWFMININQSISILNHNYASVLSYSPFNINVSLIMLSTTDSGSTLNMYVVRPLAHTSGLLDVLSKNTSTVGTYLFRKHF